MALERIARRDDQNIRIEADSLLVVSQLNGAFGVRSPSIKPLFRHAINIIQRLRSRGITLEIHHIFREHNSDADGLANDGADGSTNSTNW